MKQETGTSRTSPTTLGVRKSTGKKKKQTPILAIDFYLTYKI